MRWKSKQKHHRRNYTTSTLGRLPVTTFTSLLSIPKDGQAHHQNFLDSCIVDPNRSEEKITKAKMKTFSDRCARNRRTTNENISELWGTRDLIGHLVVL